MQCGGKFIKIIEPPEKIKSEKVKILSSKKKKVGSKRPPARPSRSKEKDLENNATLDDFLAQMNTGIKKSITDMPDLLHRDMPAGQQPLEESKIESIARTTNAPPILKLIRPTLSNPPQSTLSKQTKIDDQKQEE